MRFRHDDVDDIRTLHHRAIAHFGDLVHAVDSGQWQRPTPCAEWTVRDLVGHVTAENLWTVPLLSGATIAEVGDRFEGDVLDDDPVRAWDDAAAAARDAVDQADTLDRTIHLSYGDTTGDAYVRELLADHVVHAWDLARAIDADDQLDPQLVRTCATWFDGMEDAYRQAGAIGPREAVAADADATTRLLARFGRSATRFLVERFTHAFNAHDVDAVMRLMTDDCVFESTGPAPDGRRYAGQAEVRSCWVELFAGTPSARFDAEDLMAAPDHAVLRWTYRWDGGHVRGVDILRIRDRRIAGKYSYVKG